MMLKIILLSESDSCLMLVWGMGGSAFCNCLQICVKKTINSSLFSMVASKFFLFALMYCSYVFC
jgi:hypothetical protein